MRKTFSTKSILAQKRVLGRKKSNDFIATYVKNEKGRYVRAKYKKSNPKQKHEKKEEDIFNPIPTVTIASFVSYNNGDEKDD